MVRRHVRATAAALAEIGGVAELIGARCALGVGARDAGDVATEIDSATRARAAATDKHGGGDERAAKAHMHGCLLQNRRWPPLLAPQQAT